MHGISALPTALNPGRPIDARITTLSATETNRAIDPSIVGSDRDVLLSVIAQSPLRAKIADGSHPVVLVLYDAKEKRFISNRSGMAEHFESLDPVGGTQNLYRSRSGRSFAGPGPDPRPTGSQSTTVAGVRTTRDYFPILDRHSGPYRRLYTSANHFETGTFPSSAMAENSFVTMPPCGSARYKAGTRDAGYVYFGGWGSLGNSVDAGLQHVLPVSGQDSYQMFISLNQFFIQPADDIFHNNTFPHIACGATVTLHFETSTTSDGYLALILTSQNFAIGYKDSLRQLSPWGWSAVCTGCVLKRMVSIAQAPEDLTSGSAFGPVKWQASNVICDIGSQGCTVPGNELAASEGFTEPINGSPWAYPVIGGCMEYPQWNPTGVPPPFPTDCSGTPNNGQPYAVQVNWQDAANETDQITLPSAPNPTPTPAVRTPQDGCGKNNCL